MGPVYPGQGWGVFFRSKGSRESLQKRSQPCPDFSSMPGVLTPNGDQSWNMETTGQVFFTVRFGVKHVALLSQLELVNEKHDQETDQKGNQR